jgi:putative addiction module CopG family antidote
MNVRLSPEHEALIREKVASGDYLDEDEVIGEALAALERIEEERRAALLAALEEGEADLREGRFTRIKGKEELDALFAKLCER